MEYGPGAYTCENADNAQIGLAYIGNRCMCNSTFNPFRLLYAEAPENIPTTSHNAYLGGSEAQQPAWMRQLSFGCWSGTSPGSPPHNGSWWCSPNGSTGYTFSLAQWQAKGQEVGTVVGPMPSHTEILREAREKLRPMYG